MAGGYQEVGRDLVGEVIAARRVVVELPKQPVEEDIADFLFPRFTNLLKPHLPQDPNPELMHIPEELTGEKREAQSRKTHMLFMGEIARQKAISNAEHILMATILRDEQKVSVRIQLQPGSGYLLQSPARIEISFPDSVVKDTFILREKSARIQPGGQALTPGHEATLRNLLADLRRPTTEIHYIPPEESVVKESPSSPASS
jgi:hypothetical protein